MLRKLAVCALALLLVLGMIAGVAEVTATPAELPAAEVEWALNAPEDGEAETGLPLMALILPKKATIGVGETLQLEPQPEPEGAIYTLTYTSSDEACVSVSESGMVTGLMKGKAYVTAMADNGVKARVKVVVKKAPKKVRVLAEKTALDIGERLQLGYKLSTSSAGSCVFATAQTDILDVTPEGLVTALAAGTAHLTVTAYNGVSAGVDITVRPEFDVTFMSIGRNDGILVRCGGEYAFIDSGVRRRGIQAVKYMKSWNVPRLRYYIASHAHEDHVGGAPAIVAAIETDEVIVAYDGAAKKIWEYAKTDAERDALRSSGYRVVNMGETLPLGDASFLVLGPVAITRCDPKKTPENYNSLILRLTYGENTFLLTGDGMGGEFKKINETNPGCLKAQVFKNPHHEGANEYAAKLCAPEITVFSTGSSNLPGGSYLSFIRKLGSAVYITADNRHGHVTISSDGKNLTVETQKQYGG